MCYVTGLCLFQSNNGKVRLAEVSHSCLQRAPGGAASDGGHSYPSCGVSRKAMTTYGSTKTCDAVGEKR